MGRVLIGLWLLKDQRVRPPEEKKLLVGSTKVKSKEKERTLVTEQRYGGSRMLSSLHSKRRCRCKKPTISTKQNFSDYHRIGVFLLVLRNRGTTPPWAPYHSGQ